MNYADAHSPNWANTEHTAINLTVDFGAMGVLPFCATPDDIEPHGRDLYARAVAGEFGLVAEYVAPIAAPLTADQARAERNRRLSASDWTQLPDVPAAVRDAWATYRQALRDVPGQSGFPAAINWPAPPAGL